MLQFEEWGISLKLRFKGVQFQILITFLAFALGILVVLISLQNVLIKPYYRNIKSNTAKTVATEIESILESEEISQASLDKILSTAISYNVCPIIYYESGKLAYDPENLGASCIFNQTIRLSNETRIRPTREGTAFLSLVDETNNEFSQIVENPKTKQETIIYGTKINSQLVNYYLFVNSPIDPLDTTLEIFTSQYFYMALIVMGISILASGIFSKFISKPILKIKSSADELAQGNYDVHFEGKSYTEIEELAHTLNEAADKLGKVDELRKDLIANVSHDIKTPLTMIRAYAEMIKDISGDNPEKREEHLDVIVKETEYLDRLVLDMQELSKMQSGTYELNCSYFNIKEKIDEIVMLYQGLIDEHQILLEVECENDYTVYADEIKIGQVIANFISNAIKHSADGTKITIRVKKRKRNIRIEISDNGSGIAPEDLPYIWDRYYKINKKFKRSSNGSGLGLAIVRAILEAHNMEYGVESELNKGTTFFFEMEVYNEIDE